MPFFFIVSGLFHKHTGEIQWGKYAKKTLFNVLVFNIVYIVLGGILYNQGWWSWTPKEYDVQSTALLTMYEMAKCFAKGIILSKNMPNGVTWFLLALFYCKVLCDCYLKYRKVTLSLICILIAISFFVKLPLWTGQGAVAFSFYLLGHHFKKHILDITNKPHRLFWAVVLLLLTACLSLLNGKVSIFSLTYGELTRPFNVLVFYVNALIGSTMLLVLSSYVNKENSIVSFFSGSLVSILVLQMFFIATCRTFFGEDLPNIVLGIVFTLAIMVFCVFIDKTYSYIQHCK